MHKSKSFKDITVSTTHYINDFLNQVNLNMNDTNTEVLFGQMLVAYTQ